MILIEHLPDRDIIVLRASGQLRAREYDDAIPEIEHALKLAKGPLRVLIRLEDFRGWTIPGLWQELKFDIRHRNDFDRVAVICESRLEEWGTRLATPFFDATIRYFRPEQEDEAMAWLSVESENS